MTYDLELRVKELEKQNRQLWNNIESIFGRITDMNSELSTHDIWIRAKTCRFLEGIENKIRECEEEGD